MGAEEGGGDYQKIPRPKIRRIIPRNIITEERRRVTMAFPFPSLSTKRAITLRTRITKAKGMLYQFIQPRKGIRAIRNITNDIRPMISTKVPIVWYYKPVGRRPTDGMWKPIS